MPIAALRALRSPRLLVSYSLLLITTTHALTNITIDDTDTTSIVYTGQWSEFASELDYGGSHAFSSDASALATFSFTGVAVYYLSPRWPYAVSTSLTLDGGPVVALNLTDPLVSPMPEGGSESAAWDVIWSATGLANTSHSLVVQMAPVDGIYVIVDGFIYTVDDRISNAPFSSKKRRSKTLAIALSSALGGIFLTLIAALTIMFLLRRQNRRDVIHDLRKDELESSHGLVPAAPTVIPASTVNPTTPVSLPPTVTVPPTVTSPSTVTAPPTVTSPPTPPIPFFPSDTPGMKSSTKPVPASRTTSSCPPSSYPGTLSMSHRIPSNTRSLRSQAPTLTNQNATFSAGTRYTPSPDPPSSPDEVGADFSMAGIGAHGGRARLSQPLRPAHLTAQRTVSSPVLPTSALGSLSADPVPSPSQTTPLDGSHWRARDGPQVCPSLSSRAESTASDSDSLAPSSYHEVKGPGFPV